MNNVFYWLRYWKELMKMLIKKLEKTDDINGQKAKQNGENIDQEVG